MKITLAPKEMLQVDFANTDGQFNIHFDTVEYDSAIVVEEVSGCTPNLVGRTGIIYHDSMSAVGEGELEGDEDDDFDIGVGSARSKAAVETDTTPFTQTLRDITDFHLQLRNKATSSTGGDTRHVGMNPALSAPYGVAKDPVAPVGFFMDDSNKVHCTALVRCQLYRQQDGTYLVEVLSNENDVRGEYTFYSSIKDLEIATGMEYDPPTLA